MEKLGKLSMEKVMKDPIGNKPKPFLQGPMILLYQVTLHSTQLALDYGNHSHSTNSISMHLIVLIMKKHFKQGKELSISQVFCIQMTKHKVENN